MLLTELDCFDDLAMNDWEAGVDNQEVLIKMSLLTPAIIWYTQTQKTQSDPSSR